MSKTNDKLASMGKRLCEYAKSIGCRVEWKTACKHFLYLEVKAPDSIYSAWESITYKASGGRARDRAYCEFADFVIAVEPESQDADVEFGSPILDALAYVMTASSAEELDLRLSVLGF